MENNVTTAQQSSFEMTAVGQMLKQFEVVQRMGLMYSKATIVPATYQNNVSNCAIAINMSLRMNADPMMVMQNLYMVHGNPSFSSKFLISCINACGRFTPLQYDMEYDAKGNPIACTAYAYPSTYHPTGDDRTDNKFKLKGDRITWDMVQKEGWAGKNGSKWVTMPGQMFRYRAAAFWQRVYAPEISMGIISTEEANETEWAEYEEVQTKPRRTRKQHQDAQTLLENMVSGKPEEEEVPEEVIAEPAPAEPALSSNLETLFA